MSPVAFSFVIRRGLLAAVMASLLGSVGLVASGCGIAPAPQVGGTDAGETFADGGGEHAADAGRADAGENGEGDGGTGTDGGVVPDAGVTDAGVEGAELIAARPYRFVVPPGHDATAPAPLVVLFHGYGADGANQDLYFGLGAVAQREGFLLATPDGTFDSSARRFWNATDACCDFESRGIDDVAYFRAVVADVRSKFAVDPKRIYAVGHSNGGFMAHRLACDAADVLAAIVSLAGAGFADEAACQPSAPVSVLQVHGTADATILYGGGALFGRAYPSAQQTVADWASRNGCSAVTEEGNAKDLVPTLVGAETAVRAHGGCTGGAAELWTVQNGGHIPAFNTNATQPGSWPQEVWRFLRDHPKP